MLKETFRNSGTLGKLLQLFFITLFLGIAAMGIVSVIFGTTTLINDQKVMQLILSLFTFLIPPVVVGYLWYERPAAAYGLTQKPDGKQIILAVLLNVPLLFKFLCRWVLFKFLLNMFVRLLFLLIQ